MVVLQALICRMEVMANDAYRVEHDRSKNLSHYHDILKLYIDHQHEVEFWQSQIATIRFPLKLTSVTEVDSRTSPAVQIADVLIGAAIEAANGLTGLRSSLLDSKAVMSLYRDDQLIHMVPSIDFADPKRFRQGAQAAELIEYFAANFNK